MGPIELPSTFSIVLVMVLAVIGAIAILLGGLDAIDWIGNHIKIV